MSKEADKHSPPTRQLVYLEDDQMWTTTPYLFETNCPWPVERLEKLAQSVPGAGRISVSFHEFAGLLHKAGFSCTLLNRYPQSAQYGEVPAGYDVVKGPTGNY